MSSDLIREQPLGPDFPKKDVCGVAAVMISMAEHDLARMPMAAGVVFSREHKELLELRDIAIAMATGIGYIAYESGNYKTGDHLASFLGEMVAAMSMGAEIARERGEQ